jgi:predicted CXXCH cytochrome family protein
MRSARRLLLAFLVVSVPAAVLAAAPIQPARAGSNDDCLACHNDKGLKSAAGKSVFIDPGNFSSSIHTQADIGCLDCHADLKGVKDFPHAEKLKPAACAACHDKEAGQIKKSVHGQPQTAANPITVSCADCHGTHDIRGKDDAESSVFSINIPETCESCHAERVKTKKGNAFVMGYNRSAHFKALQKAGLGLSATCVNCHGGHDVRPVADADSRVSRKAIVHTCGRCHVGIEKNYLEGVHGKDFVKGGQDVPVCTDCHSEHSIQGPGDVRSDVYATKIAGVCTRCHDDERLARQYGLLTSRLKSYAGSFHGTASKFGETRVANCASCHGFHDIRTSADPKSSIYPANLARTCGQCHAGAGSNFAKGKIHVVSTQAENRTGRVVKLVYIIVIAGLISVFLLFIAADLFHRMRTRWTNH